MTYNASDSVFEIDVVRGTTVFYQNGVWAPALSVRTGRNYGSDDLLANFVDMFVDRDDRDKIRLRFSIAAIVDEAKQGTALISEQTRILNPLSGQYEWYQVSVMTSVAGKCHGTIQNINVEKLHQLELQRKAEKDTLTDLLNRSAFEKAVSEHIENKKTQGAYYIVDIDDIKAVNDSGGHQLGDKVILDIAELLSSNMPAETIIGRFGGDEFMMFYPKEGTAEDYQEAAEKVLKAVIELDDGPAVTLSIGAALYPMHGSTIGELLECADKALYSIKTHGKNGIAVYDPDMPKVENIVRLPAVNAAEIKKKRLKRKTGICVSFFLFAVCTVLAVLCSVYLNTLNNVIEAESADYLSEFSGQVNENVSAAVSDNIDFLTALSREVGALAKNHTLSEICGILAQQSNDTVSFDKLSLIDKDGTWYTQTAHNKYEILSTDLATAVKTRKAVISNTINIDSGDYSIIILPIEPVKADGHEICAFAAFISSDKLSRMLNLHAFEGRGFADIVSKAGDVVVRSNNAASLADGYNLFSGSISQAVLTDGTTAEDIKNNLASQKPGAFRYSLNSIEYVSYYSKLKDSDRIIICTAASSKLEGRSDDFVRFAMIACIIVALIILALIIEVLFMQFSMHRNFDEGLYVDKITGGATRERFVSDLPELLKQKAAKYSLLYANIENFKQFSDRGVELSDKLLCYVHNIINESLRPDEIAAHLSGDNFVILMRTHNIKQIEYRARLLNRTIRLQAADGDTSGIKLSYGVYRIDEPQVQPDVFIERANLARLGIKSGSTDKLMIAYYDERLMELLRRKNKIESGMVNAIKNRELQVYLQPLVNATTGKTEAYEALSRWLQPDGSMLYPKDFIPLFEKNGFIVKLDLYVFERVCEILTNIKLNGGNPTRISINVSGSSLCSSDIVGSFVEIWRRFDIKPELIEFEFSEKTVLGDVRRLSSVINLLHSYGFMCSVDGFGSGYSSLNTLLKSNIDVIKLDNKFLCKTFMTAEQSLAVIRGVVALSKKLGIRTVVEGVETLEQAEYLRNIGCDVIQGYLYSKPTPSQVLLDSICDTPDDYM